MTLEPHERIRRCSRQRPQSSRSLGFPRKNPANRLHSRDRKHSRTYLQFKSACRRSVPMDGPRFDRLTRAFATRSSRRSVLKRALGVAGLAAIAGPTLHDAEAARRGFSGPRLPVPCTGPECAGRPCQLPSDCPPCQCIGPQARICNTCDPDLGICFSYRSDCSGCCETVDDVGQCGCNPG